MTDQPDTTDQSDLVSIDHGKSVWSRMSELIDNQKSTQPDPHASGMSDLETALLDTGDDPNIAIEALTDPSVLPVTVFPFLRQVGDRLAKHLAYELRKKSGTLVDVAIVDQVNMRMGNAMASIPVPSLIGVLVAETQSTHIFCVADGPMAALHFDLVLGGAQVRSHYQPPPRNFSVIETQLFQILVETIASSANAAFTPLAAVEIKADRVETNSRFLPSGKAQDSVIKMRFLVQCAARSGFLDCYLPTRFLAPIDARTRPAEKADLPSADPLWQHHFKTRLLKSHIEMRANLSDLSIPLYRLRGLKKGDVFELDKGPDSLIDLVIDNRVLARGRMGQSTGKIAIRIEERVNATRETGRSQ